MGNANSTRAVMTKGPGRVCCYGSGPLPDEPSVHEEERLPSVQSLQQTVVPEPVIIPPSPTSDPESEPEPPAPEPPKEPVFIPPTPRPSLPMTNVNSIPDSIVSDISWNKTLAEILNYPPMTREDCITSCDLWTKVRAGLIR